MLTNGGCGAASSVWRPALLLAQAARRRPPAGRLAAVDRADRSHGHVGVGRQRGLALADDDAGQGRLCQPAAHDAGRKAADAWDYAGTQTPENACKPFGVGNIMRMPGRIRISWQDDVDAEAGVRRRHTDAAPALRRRAAAGRSRAGRAIPWRRGRSPDSRSRSTATASRWRRRRLVAAGAAAAAPPSLQRRRAARRHHQLQARLPAQERRALQRSGRRSSSTSTVSRIPTATWCCSCAPWSRTRSTCSCRSSPARTSSARRLTRSGRRRRARSIRRSSGRG